MFDNLLKRFAKKEKPVQTKDEPVKQEPKSITIADKEYTYAPLRASLLPTPAQLKNAVMTVDQDPRPMLDVIRKLAVADMHLLGVTATRRDALLGYDFKIEPPEGLEEDTNELKKCGEIENRLRATNHGDALKNIVNGIIYGHSVTIPHWLINSKNQYYPQFEPIDFVHFAKKNGKLHMIADKSDADFVITIGTNAAITGTADTTATAYNLSKSGSLIWSELDYNNLMITESNPFEGLMKNYIGGLMRPALYLTLLKFYNILDWAKFNELFGMPVRVGKFDPIMSSDKAIAILKTAVQNLGTDASAVIDKTTEIEFLQANGSISGGKFAYESFANHIEDKQSILYLGQTLTTQVSSSGGNRALGQVHDLVRMDKLWVDLLTAQERFTRDVVAKDYFYNYGLSPNGNFPKYILKTDEYKDLSLMATVVRDLSASGKEFDSAWADEFFGTKGPENQTPVFGGSKNPFGGL